MQYVDYFGYGLHQLVYVSRMERPLGAVEIDQIVIRAAAANRAQSITGALLVYGDTFVQVLEGGYAAVKPLFQRIEADTRHTAITLKAVEPLDRRRFGRWGMRLGTTPQSEAVNLLALTGPQLVTLLALSVGRTRSNAA